MHTAKPVRRSKFGRYELEGRAGRLSLKPFVLSSCVYLGSLPRLERPLLNNQSLKSKGWSGERWEVSTELDGGWTVVVSRNVPPRLAAKHAHHKAHHKRKAHHKKRKHAPAKHGH